MATLDDALEAFPVAMRGGLIDAYYAATATVLAMLERGAMTPGVALMAGLALDPRGRAALDVTLQDYAGPSRELPAQAPEVIIGGGAHAAVYASVRVAQGFPRPLVLDASERFGGTFAGTVAPSFYLNSRNRPGPSGAPGTRDALNVIPAAPMQPADIGGTEYQTDADMGLVIRCALALNAEVRTARVESLDAIGNGGAIVKTDRGEVAARRVIVATGIGAERTVNGVIPDGQTVYSFSQWMRRVGSEPFPLQDVGRVAVIGAGDGARTVVESLAGIGPMTSATVASLDYIERIDWYGIRDCADTRDGWIGNNRTRYQRLGALFPVAGRDNARVTPLPRAATLAPGYRAAQVDGRSYETVIVAAGYDIADGFVLNEGTLGNRGEVYRPNGIALGRATRELDVLRIGPCAALAFESGEDNRIGENAFGLFRLAPRTATLAATLPAV